MKVLSTGILSESVLEVAEDLTMEGDSIAIHLEGRSGRRREVVLEVGVLNMLYTLTLVGPLSVVKRSGRFALRSLVPNKGARDHFIPHGLGRLR